MASSSAPARSVERRSHSVVLKRHGRTFPSAVRRRRLHAPQKGLLTGAMKPMRPGKPSAKVKVRAVLESSGVAGAVAFPARLM